MFIVNIQVLAKDREFCLDIAIRYYISLLLFYSFEQKQQETYFVCVCVCVFFFFGKKIDTPKCILGLFCQAWPQLRTLTLNTDGTHSHYNGLQCGILPAMPLQVHSNLITYKSCFFDSSIANSWHFPEFCTLELIGPSSASSVSSVSSANSATSSKINNIDQWLLAVPKLTSLVLSNIGVSSILPVTFLTLRSIRLVSLELSIDEKSHSIMFDIMRVSTLRSLSLHKCTAKLLCTITDNKDELISPIRKLELIDHSLKDSDIYILREYLLHMPYISSISVTPILDYDWSRLYYRRF